MQFCDVLRTRNQLTFALLFIDIINNSVPLVTSATEAKDRALHKH